MIFAIAVMGLLTGVVREWCCFDLRKVPDLGFLGNLLNQLIVIFSVLLGVVFLLDEVQVPVVVVLYGVHILVVRKMMSFDLRNVLAGFQGRVGDRSLIQQLCCLIGNLGVFPVVGFR